MVRRLIHLTLLLVLATAGCSRSGPVDLAGLDGRARGGEAAAFRELVDLLGREENQLSSRAYGVVIDLGQAVVPYLLAEIKTDDVEAREHILAALGTLKVKEAIPGIAEVSIGHALTIECIDHGMSHVVERYLEICRGAAPDA